MPLLVLTLLLALADLTGTWQAEVEVAGNAGGPSFTLKQAADGTLSGTYEGALGSAPLKGKVAGDKVEWSFEVEPQGEKITVTYQGTVKGDGSMSGKLSIPGLGEGSWTARKR